MKISIKEGKDCEKILKIEIPSESIQKEYETFYNEVTPKAKIPGFRPGKAPRHVIEMHFKGEAREQVMKNLISDSYGQAVRDQALEPMGYPEINDVKFDDKVLSYQALVETRPKIKLNKITGLSAKKEKVEISPKELEESMTRMRESLAQYKAVEDRPAAMGDFVIADYVCYVGDKEVEKRDDDWFELKEDEFLKGFSPQLVGVSPGDERELRVTFPDKISNPDMAGKEGVFKVKAKEIKTKILPELNDELAKEAGGECNSLDELKQKIQQGMLAQKEQAADAQYEKALLEDLVKQNKMDLPQKMVERRLQYLMEQTKERMVSQGATPEQFESQKDKMKDDLMAEARRQIHVAFLLEEISNKENITVSEDDLKERLSMIAERFKHSPEEVDKYYAGNEEAREQLRDQIRSAKTIAFLKENAKSKEK